MSLQEIHYDTGIFRCLCLLLDTDRRKNIAGSEHNLLLQNAYVLVMACGMLLCILTGGNADLSVGSTLCLAAASAGQVMANGGSIGTVIAAALGIALVIGICHGFLIGWVHISGLDVRSNCPSALIAVIVIAVLIAIIFVMNRRRSANTNSNASCFIGGVISVLSY